MEDVKISAESQRLLALTEHPTWGAFVRMVDADLKRLDNISSLVLENRSDVDLVNEIKVRYQTILKIEGYINETISRAEQALVENQDQKSDIIKFHN